MDKSDKKKQEEALKNSFMPALANQAAFMDAASLLGKHILNPRSHMSRN
jgi:hypothetical protein